MSAQAIGYTELTPLTRYGELFRVHRKMLSQSIGTRTLVERFETLQATSVRRFLLRLLQTPEDYHAHITRSVHALFDVG